MKIQLFVTCLIDSLFPEVGEAVVETLVKAGLDIGFPQAQTCCGQPAFNAGYRSEARRMARYTIDVFNATEGPVIIPSGSCADMVKYQYLELFKDDPIYLPRAQQLSERTYEFSQFLVDVLGYVDFGTKYQGKLAYHPSCHLLRGMGVDIQPKALLAATGADVFPLEEECCGFGGVFAVDQAELSTELLRRKLKAVEESGSATVVAGDVSCLMHIEGGLRQKGSKIRCAHLAQIIAGKTPGLK